MSENVREIVNGALLPQFNGKNVSVTGLITNKAPSGLTFEMRAADDALVKVNLKKPYRGNLEGYVEVQGIAQGKTVICDNLVQFSMDEGEDFDVAAHNRVCQLLHSVPGLWDMSA